MKFSFTINQQNRIPIIKGILFMFLLNSCTIHKEYLFMNRNCSHCDTTPVFYTNNYEKLRISIKYQDDRQFSYDLAVIINGDILIKRKGGH